MASPKKIGQPTLCVVLFVFLLTGFAAPTHAVDVAPRISDREIIESLADLKAGQKVLAQRMDGLDKRMDGLDRRIEAKFSVLIQLFMAILAMIGALIGFILWDRRAIVQPVKEQLEGVKQVLDGVKRDLDLHIRTGHS